MKTRRAEADPVRRESPLYVQLAMEFRRLITRNAWPVGSRVPTVEKLAVQYSVARVTIRQAMDLLAQEGLVIRSRGRGTQVVKAPMLLRWHKLSAEWDEFMQPANGASSMIIEDRPVTNLPEVAPHEGTVQGSYRFIRVVSRRGDGPIVVARDVYVQTAVYKVIKDRISQGSLIDFWREHVDRVTIFTEISAAVPRIAQLLGVPIGTPVLEARHVGVDRRGVIIYIEFPVLRGDYVKYEIVVTRPGISVEP